MTLVKRLYKHRWQYGLILPGAVALILFSYFPMYGMQIAFKDFQMGNTIANSPWDGWSNFSFLQDPYFWTVVSNTVFITVLKFVMGFPAPIILALLINEVRAHRFKRWVQSIVYVPHFISWIVVAYILSGFLSPDGGLINQLLNLLGLHSIYFMGDAGWFRPIVVLSGVWKETGWNTILYMAAIIGIEPQLYEAAVVEGAGRWAQLRYVTLPGMIPIITIVLILTVPQLVNVGLDQIYPLQNPANLPVSDVLDTYVLRTGLQQGEFGPAAAIGVISSTISLFLVLTTNWISRWVTGQGLW